MNRLQADSGWAAGPGCSMVTGEAVLAGLDQAGDLPLNRVSSFTRSFSSTALGFLKFRLQGLSSAAP